MATFAEEELDEDLIREARANSQHLLGTPMAHAFKNYGADRAKQAKDAALQAKLADALKTGVKLDEARLNPNAAREYDARVAADVARAAAAAHGTVSDDDDDDDDGEKPAEAEATRADCLKAAEVSTAASSLNKRATRPSGPRVRNKTNIKRGRSPSTPRSTTWMSWTRSTSRSSGRWLPTSRRPCAP